MAQVGELDDLRHLVVGAVREPGTAPERGATVQELHDLGLRLGQPLPEALAAWLTVCRGEAIGAGGVFGCRPDEQSLDIGHILEIYPEWAGRGWIPVASDGCGNYYVLIDGGDIGFVDTMESFERLHIEAPDLFTFLREYLARDQAEESYHRKPLYWGPRPQ